LARYARTLGLTLALAALAVGALPAAAKDASLAAAQPRFDPETFFEGRTEGKGELKLKFGDDEAIRVTSSGSLAKDGTLVLDQTIFRPGKKPQDRQWRLRSTGNGRYTGTLSDARTPVEAEVRGNALHIAYVQEEGGVKIEQALYLAADGRSAENRTEILKFGMTVGTVTETIRKLD
jgi:hypothetical protein